MNVAGDDQADRNFHGGPDKAVYAYAREDYAWWAEELARPVEDATFGENLTLEGLDVCAAVIGERWSIGSTLLEVAGPRTPCWKLGARMNDPEFPVWFAAAGRRAPTCGSSRKARSPPGTTSRSSTARAMPSRSATWPASTTAAGAGPSSSGLPSSGRSGAPGSRSDSRARALSFPGSPQAVAVSDGCAFRWRIRSATSATSCSRSRWYSSSDSSHCSRFGNRCRGSHGRSASSRGVLYVRACVHPLPLS